MLAPAAADETPPHSMPPQATGTSFGTACETDQGNGHDVGAEFAADAGDVPEAEP
jgi:hypothetical protein